MLTEADFTTKQLSRIDEVENAVYQLLRLLTEDDSLPWNMEYIGEVADLAADCMVRCGHSVRYPSIVENTDGTSHIVNYHPKRETP